MGDEVTSRDRWTSTRLSVQRACAHVISRDRHRRDGHIGLRWTGDGIGTDHLWIAADGLHRAPDGAVHPLTTIDGLAAFAGVDLAAAFSVGRDTPPLEGPLDVDPAALADLVAFFGAAWPLLVELAEGEPVTLWPEHFDAAFVWREVANVGASPGDDHQPAPYVYVGPWGPERPGGAEYWNAAFGAVQAFAGDASATRAFVGHGLSLLSA